MTFALFTLCMIARILFDYVTTRSACFLTMTTKHRRLFGNCFVSQKPCLRYAILIHTVLR